MAIDPSISLGIRPPQIAPLQIQTPLDRYQKMLTLRHLMTQGQLGQMNLEQTRLENEALQRTSRDEQSLGSWMQQNQRPDLTPQEIVTANPNPTGIKFATAWSAQKTAALNQHKAGLDVAFEEAKTDDRIYNSVTDDNSKLAALTELVRLKRIDGAQASQLAAIPFDSPEFKGIQQRVAAQSQDRLQRIEARQKEIALRIAENTEKSATAGGIAEGEKKVLDAAQAQKAADAAMVAAGFGQSPEAGAAIIAAIGKIDPKRAERFQNVTDAAGARTVGMTVEQQAADERAAAQLKQGSYGKTEVYPPPVQAQKVEEAAAMAGARQNVLDTPEKMAQDLEKKRREAEIAATVNKALSGEASKVYAIATTMGEDIAKLRAGFKKDYRGAQRGILIGTDRDLRLAAERLADKVGRLRSGGAINKEEEARFMGQLASAANLAMGNSKASLNALDQIEEEAGIVARSIRPQETTPPAGQQKKGTDPLGIR